jgi:PAS domain S-box-containing protein
MKKRLVYGAAVVALVICVLLVVSQAFNLAQFGPQFGPADPTRTFVFWFISILIFVLMVTLGFILFREGLKLYIARQSKVEGSRIRTKLVVGALALCFVPVCFQLIFSFDVLSHSMKAWFTNPTSSSVDRFVRLSNSLEREVQDEINIQAALLASQPEARQLLNGGARTPGFLERFCQAQQLESAALLPPTGDKPLDVWGPYRTANVDNVVHARLPVTEGTRTLGYVELATKMPADVSAWVADVRRFDGEWKELQQGALHAKLHYTMLLALITLFILFLATWVALFMSKQISVPITALLEAASEVRKGNLKHRVDVRAVDELASLVRGFNQMTQELETSGRELDRRRRFTEAILESIPTGVISITTDGSIGRVNHALSKIFPPEQVARAARLEDLFSREDTAELKFLMKRARRTGVASRQLELSLANRRVHVAVTVSAVEEKLTSGFVVVLEDTTELLRGQKAAAWREVAQRVAHEIKNPLTPIALSAERIARLIDRLDMPPTGARVMRECAATISKSVESVKTLVDEFSRFARFPTLQPVRCDLNEVTAEALAVFRGRLDGISISTSFAPGLPPVNVDREQFQRVVINLVDNAAEAMQDSLVKKLYIATQPGTAETVELVVADSGCGVGPDEKEKLFLPYFSTKNRGTGLGLAIVSHIVAEHNGQIRVEDNQPVGARFTVEIPVFVEPEAADALTRPAAIKV